MGCMLHVDCSTRHLTWGDRKVRYSSTGTGTGIGTGIGETVRCSERQRGRDTDMGGHMGKQKTETERHDMGGRNRLVIVPAKHESLLARE